MELPKYEKRLGLFRSAGLEGRKAATKIPLGPPLRKGDEIEVVSKSPAFYKGGTLLRRRKNIAGMGKSQRVSEIMHN